MSDLIEIYNGTCMFCMQRALSKPVGHRDIHEYCDVQQLAAAVTGVEARG